MNAEPSPREISPSRAENLPPVVLIAASADGIAAITAITAALPRDFPAAIVIVQHRPATVESFLTSILAKRTQLPVDDAVKGQRLNSGTLFVASPKKHLTFTENGFFQYVDGIRIRHSLSSANPLFESAARIFGPKAIAVVLTGSGMDATDGVQAIKTHGGTVIAQDPATARFQGMPTSAIRTGAVDFVLSLPEIGPRLLALVQQKQEKGR